ncbi:type III pantothenate kinase [Alteromonas sp. CYL-A6]|uniref:type III pantothenate kinase n=1 Tax=Alteromonas nitratireducens TaxID=3390813 RepID=UPI0034B41F3F
MVSEDTVILVDVGNTRIKAQRLSQLGGEPAVFDDWPALHSYLQRLSASHIYFASVRQQSVSDEFIAWCASHNMKCREIITEREAFGITNSYQNVGKMGVDRWLAMLGAAELASNTFCVIDTGTATTVDFVSNGKHLGGWIVPGYQTMKSALVSATKRVTADASVPDTLDVGNDTEACVSQGCHAAVIGVYLSAVDYLSRKQTPFDVILSGGDKKLFANVELGGSIRSANLVVHGLARYARRELYAS